MKAHSQQVVRWQKKNKKILLRKVSHESIADENNPIYKSVRNNNFEPVVYGFEIKTVGKDSADGNTKRSEEHTSELQSRFDLVCRLLLEKKKINKKKIR